MAYDIKVSGSTLPRGVIFTAYPDSIGENLSDTIAMLSRPEFEDVFSLFYVLPTFFHSDLDGGFSVIDYDLEEELATHEDLEALRKLGIAMKFDLVLNHLSVASPQFEDMVANGDDSPYRDFFIDWNKFWQGNGEMSPEGYIVPDKEHLDKLFMRKPGLPILMVRFPDGSERPYWNTFYQEVNYVELNADDLAGIETLTPAQVETVIGLANAAIRDKTPVSEVDFGELASVKDKVVHVVEGKRTYLGQMDLNAKSEKVWEFYDETLKKLSSYGAKVIRLDAFAYLHKEVGEPNFFNKPGTWDYLARIRDIAEKYELTLLQEIHSQHGKGLHAEVAAEGYPIYDFFFPGLVIDALDQGTRRHLIRWIDELLEKDISTVNMLGCHDGIPVLDLEDFGDDENALISHGEIDAIVDRVLDRGGRVKNLFGADGKKISYYQVNATFFSALGEDERKLLLARAIQMFMPGVPQVWYLDLFAGINDYEAADRGGTGGHKEINRTRLTAEDVEAGLKRDVVLKQLEIMRLRRTTSAFLGGLTVHDTPDHLLHMTRSNDGSYASLLADLRGHSFTITCMDEDGTQHTLSYE